MKVLILGSKGMVGSSVARLLSSQNDYEIIESSREDTDLFSKEETGKLIFSIKPDVIINAAAKVGGILANDTQTDKFYNQQY